MLAFCHRHSLFWGSRSQGLPLRGLARLGTTRRRMAGVQAPYLMPTSRG